MRIYIACLFVLISFFGVQAQSGFLGKKFSVQIGIEPILVSKLYHSNTDTIKIYNQENSWFKNTLNGQLNYAISTRNELSLSVSAINSKYLIDSINIFNGKTINLNYRIYEKNKGSIAPIGKYVSLGLLYHRATYHRTDTSNKIRTIGVSAGIGIQRAISKRIIYNIHYQVWLPAYTHYTVDPNAFIKAATPKDYISELSKSSIVSLQIKFGFLIF